MLKSNWITSKNRKHHQRMINKKVRLLNKNIKNDYLWQGRFYVRQVDTPKWLEYQDKSGADLIVTLCFCDKKTNNTYTHILSVNEWCFCGGLQLWHRMNDFIVREVSVWSEDPRPGTKEWFDSINW